MPEDLYGLTDEQSAELDRLAAERAVADREIVEQIEKDRAFIDELPAKAKDDSGAPLAPEAVEIIALLPVAEYARLKDGLRRAGVHILADLERAVKAERRKMSTTQPAGAPVMKRGDEVEAGRALADKLLAESDGPLVSAEGMLWVYQPERGIFAEVGRERCAGIVQGMAGTLVGHGEDKFRPLTVSSHFAEGSHRCALVDQEIYQPDFFSNAAPGLAFANVFVTVDADGLHEHQHSPDHRARVALDFDFNEDAEFPEWKKALGAIFRDDPDIEDKCRAFQEFVGAALLGIAPSYQRALVFLGDGENGKSIAIEVVTSLFPASAMSNVPPQKWATEYYRAELRGKRLNSLSELPESDVLDSSAFKAIVTGDEIGARRPYERPFSFRPRAGHLFAANTLPGTVDLTHAFFRRFLIVTFNRSFDRDPERVDRDELLSGLFAERPGIVLWALHGAVRLLRNGGYTIPASHAGAVQQWRVEADSVAGWAHDTHVVVPVAVSGPSRGDVVGDWRGAGELYQSYSAWCRDEGRFAVSSVKFATRLRLLGFVRHEIDRGRFWNLRIRTDADFMDGMDGNGGLPSIGLLPGITQ
jgi:P4 family phage/plasmid primase-like protien